jgi:hypothetical protein
VRLLGPPPLLRPHGDVSPRGAATLVAASAQAPGAARRRAQLLKINKKWK